MAAEEKWHTSVQYLMVAFRDALVALTPYMDKVKIGWRDDEAYDDWDGICQTLFQHMVIKSLEYAEHLSEGLATPEYGMIYPCYRDLSFFDVSGTASPADGGKILVSFSTRVRPFDQVRYQLVSGPNLDAVGDSACMPITSAAFTFFANKGGGLWTRLSDILVEV